MELRVCGDCMKGNDASIAIDGTRSFESTTTHRVYGLPCETCGHYFFTDEPSCPVCASRFLSGTRTTPVALDRLSAPQPEPKHRLYGLPCPSGGHFYYADEPSCPVCGCRRLLDKRT